MRLLAVIALFAAAVLSAYEGARGNGFIDVDDRPYLVDNQPVTQGLTLEGAKWAFTTFHMGNWHPLTWMSHMLDWEVFEDDPAGHHMMNVGLHALNAALVLIALNCLTGAFWPSAMVALLWAVHPLRVESVAWAAERKDVLSACFGLLCLIAYAWYARRPGLGRYAVVFVTLALSLLAKPMLVTWPAVMLLLDAWPLRRLAWKTGLGDGADESFQPAPDEHASPHTLASLIVEKIPLFALALASSVVSVMAQRAGGAVASTEMIGVGGRISNALVSYVRYLGDTFWPTRLAPFYPHPGAWPTLTVLGAAALLAFITIAAVMLRRRQPWLIVGWLWFLGTLVPVVGLVQVGAQSMADRYTYIPQMGIVLAVVFGAWTLPRTWRLGLVLLAAVTAATLWMQTRQQVQYWRDTDTVYARSLAMTEGNWFVHNNAAMRARQRGDARAEALHVREVERHGPRNSPMLLAVVADFHLRHGQFDDAARLLEQAVALAPDEWPIVNNLAYLRAAASDERLRDPPRALEMAQRMCDQADPDSPLYPGYLDTLAAAQASVGRFEDALATSARALDLAIALGQHDLADIIVQHIRRYEAGLPAE